MFDDLLDNSLEIGGAVRNLLVQLLKIKEKICTKL